MNILLIQENGRHEANRNYRECFSLQRAFKSLGHNADVWGYGHDNYNKTPDYENYDIILNLENYGDHWLPDTSKIKKPLKLLWSIDAHCRGISPYEKIFKEGKYNYLLHSTKDFVKDSYQIWFPNCYDDTLIKPLNIPKKYNLGFVGNYANRQSILEYLHKKFNLHLDIFVIGDSMVEAINSYNIHFNLNIANDINYRSFETIGCGTMLLTNYNYQYEDLGFKNEINCLFYYDMEDLENKLFNLSQFDIKNISDNGLKLSSEHTYYKRVKSLLESINYG